MKDILNVEFGDSKIPPYISHSGATAVLGVFGSLIAASTFGWAGPLVVGTWAWNNIRYAEKHPSHGGTKMKSAAPPEDAALNSAPSPVVVESAPVAPLPAPTGRIYSENPNMPPSPESAPLRTPERESAVKRFATALAMVKPEIEVYTPRQDWDVVESLTDNLKSSLLIGVPGAGKGMLMGHWIRAIKTKYPELQIWGIDPKDDPKEAGYWAAGFDKVFRANNERMSNAELIDWLSGCLDKFRMAPDGKILVWDEFTISCRRWESGDKAGFREVTDFLISLGSSGDSRRNYVLAVGQIPNASDMGMSGGTRGIFKPIAILSNHDRRAVQQFTATTFVPVPKGGIEELYSTMDKSPCGRAIYLSSVGEWRPMPTLENLAGYDRDTRQWVGAGPTVDVPPAPSLEPDDELLARARAWVTELGDCPVTLSLAATSGWVAWGRRNGVLADAKQGTIMPWVHRLEAEGRLRPIGTTGATWMPASPKTKA